MLLWCIIIIILGVFAILLDTGIISNYNAPYCSLTWAIMLVALGILVRIKGKQEKAQKERLKNQLVELQKRLEEKE